MASINGLPPVVVPNTNKTQKQSKVKKNDWKQPTSQPTKVADAVAKTIRHVNESDIHKAQIQYDRFSDLFTKKKGTGFQARHRFEDLVVLNQKSVTQYESQLNSPLGAHRLPHFIVKELGKNWFIPLRPFP
jgi:hypothetical protein